MIPRILTQSEMIKAVPVEKTMILKVILYLLHLLLLTELNIPVVPCVSNPYIKEERV